MGEAASTAWPLVIGRYALHAEIASGGMATVYLGRLTGPVGFSRTVAVKRLLPTYAKNPEFVAMFLDEARLAARVQHPNVVPTLDVVTTEGELFVVMEYVQGEALSRLVRAAQREQRKIPLPVASAIVSGVLAGLHAAHETKDEHGLPLGIVHRDISPQNILLGADGVARVLDFGVAKAAGRVQTTSEGQIKGKVAYMAPEQARQEGLDRTADLYAAAVVLWELITLRRLFTGDNQAQVMAKVLKGDIPPPSRFASGVTPEVDAVVLRGLAEAPAARFSTGRDMALALERALRPATPTETAAWLESVAGDVLRQRSERIAEIESASDAPRVASVGALQASARAVTPRVDVGADAPAPPDSVSHVSPVEAAGRPTPRSPGGRLVWVLLGGVLAAAAFAVAHRNTPAPSPPTAASPPTVPPQAEPAAESTAPPPPTVSAQPSASAAVAANAPRAHPVHRAPALPQRPAASPAAAAAPAATCDPPYTIDSSGQKHYKPECF